MQQYNNNPMSGAPWNYSQPPPPILVPQAPEDAEQKNIIDKLANFVARNGSEFENVTKLKQKDNPKFKFLFGGDFYQYYMYKLSMERDMCKLFQEFFKANLIFF